MAESSKTKQTVYGIGLLALLALAGFFFYRNTRGPISAMPNTEESAQVFICRECQHVERLTARQQAQAMAAAGEEASKRGEMIAVRSMRLPCPACKAIAMVVAGECRECHKPYLKVTPDGTYHTLCPDCEKARGNEAETLPPDR
ncbi:MAG TPA: hypothetical protein VGM03_07355 [Phycisphaerae bacterium]|jgi:Fe2+ or Zn2+ uptake regulation protein